MTSELQRVVRAFLESVEQIPQVVQALSARAAWCRRQTMLAHQVYGAAHPNGRELIALTEDAARRCEQAAEALALVPPKARAWALDRLADPPPAGTPQPPAPAPPPASPPQSPSAPAEPGPDVVELSTANPDHHHALRNPPPNATLRVDGRFTYRTDHLGRVTHATATLTTIDLDHPRDRAAQRDLPDKGPADHAGHLFARIFQGPAAAINLTPMHGTIVNQSAYRRLENEWAKTLAGGNPVHVDVQLMYTRESRRADSIIVTYETADYRRRRTIQNSATQQSKGDSSNA